MEYNFTEKEEHRFLYDFYYVYFVNMQLKVKTTPAMSITKERARYLREVTRKKSVKEIRFKNSLIARMINIFRSIPCNRKYIHEEYDLMLLLMHYLGKDILCIEDFANLDIKKFYVDCLKSRFDKLDELRDKQIQVPLSNEKEIARLSKIENEIRKTLIPTEEEYIENINNL